MRIQEAADGVFAVQGQSVNWSIIRSGHQLVLVDAGYPGDAGEVLESLQQLGGVEKLQAILVTHGHIDHIGGIPAVLERRGVPVLASPAELGNVRREYRQQASVATVTLNLWRPGALAWTREILGKGAARDAGVPQAEAFAAQLPGGLVAVPSAGHTSGHTAYFLPEQRVLLTGDALVSGHPLRREDGPQLLPGFFHHDKAALPGGLEALASVEADAIVPGHGPVLQMNPAQAVAAVRGR